MFSRRAANAGFKAKAERIAPTDDETVEFNEVWRIFGRDQRTDKFKFFAGFKTFPAPLAAVTMRVDPNRLTMQ
ncbi:hypothetical protein DSCO28_71260 [Desulfosarcina ovata subsp. sediminis]|uniref:Uncharacterized protein n=2 Tax=Desulfosarcina ovata TaxID=83564 RepID=A0A5K8AAL6_9BACT|nr:hypothetical protein DSCO28_71260 [Desulfosarcina ovata subsp. sediminis]BBO88963.1 hypothetical protein DSCOOX_21430 [Desulfosarcina ovata subsp. ovata]BBO89559.1 hypothetical protein DSCOOX_27390 [Desulfosarcina ovata subsp. ovata]BBO92357.1 hypothetical protein DSCOOX_55370 [Desulfosarcina ovata subsp. ovata]BBO92496.1 hypothetical protein DSCOOX_56760 [Desulfosarcina ovata subsp. ovata]